MNIEQLRILLDKYINVTDLSDIEVLKIYENEMMKDESYLIGGEKNGSGSRKEQKKDAY